MNAVNANHLIEGRALTPIQAPGMMQTNVYYSLGRFGLTSKPVPHPGPGEAVIRVRMTTICETDLRIVSGQFPVEPGTTIGHEAVGIIHELGNGVIGYQIGQRVLVGAATPCWHCVDYLGSHPAQCGGTIGGGRLGHTLDGAQAEYMTVPFAHTNLALVPDRLSDEQVLLLADVASTGFAVAESAGIRLGDNVAIFGQGPIGLCATLGARLRGAARILVVDRNTFRLEIARSFGATDTILAIGDPIKAICKAVGAPGVEVAIETLGNREAFQNALAVLNPGGTMGSVGVYFDDLSIRLKDLGVGVADKKIVPTVCPGGNQRMARLMRLVESGRIDLTPLLTHRFHLDEIHDAYTLFGGQRDNVIKVAILVP